MHSSDYSPGGSNTVDVSPLRRLRQQAVMSQQQLADESGVARDTISKLETGQRRAYPTTIRKLAASLGVEPQELVEDRKADRERPKYPRAKKKVGPQTSRKRRSWGSETHPDIVRHSSERILWVIESCTPSLSYRTIRIEAPDARVLELSLNGADPRVCAACGRGR
jgi:transcriptional regulator with XRE-family HTH domain